MLSNNFRQIAVALSLAGASLLSQAATRLELDKYVWTMDHGMVAVPGGAVQTFTLSDGVFNLYKPYPNSSDYDNSVVVSFDSPSRWISLYFSTDRLGVPLAPGVYENAQRFPFNDPGRPGLWWSDTGYGSNTLDGSFQIFDVQKDAAGKYIGFAASFFVLGQGSGRIWYNSDVAIPSVPEPSSWVLMSVGLCLVGALARKRNG